MNYYVFNYQDENGVNWFLQRFTIHRDDSITVLWGNEINNVLLVFPDMVQTIFKHVADCRELRLFTFDEYTRLLEIDALKRLVKQSGKRSYYPILPN